MINVVAKVGGFFAFVLVLIMIAISLDTSAQFLPQLATWSARLLTIAIALILGWFIVRLLPLPMLLKCLSCMVVFVGGAIAWVMV